MGESTRHGPWLSSYNLQYIYIYIHIHYIIYIHMCIHYILYIIYYILYIIYYILYYIYILYIYPPFHFFPQTVTVNYQRHYQGDLKAMERWRERERERDYFLILVGFMMCGTPSVQHSAECKLIQFITRNNRRNC